MTLSSNNLNEIANLYESINISEQEVLNEFGVNLGGNAALQAKKASMAKDSAFQSRLDAMRAQRFGGTNPVVKAAKNGVQGTLDKTTGKFTASTKPAAPAATPASSRPAAASASASAKPSTQMAKTAPAKPAVPTGTTAGGTTFQRRAATGAELRAAQAARAAGKGEEGAIKAGVEASKPAATPTLSAATAAASKPAAFKPATASQATAAAPSTSPAASGSLAPATAAIAKKPTQPPVAPGYQGAKKPFAEEMDAYDLVLEYLLDNGHVDTVEEAHYVMMELDAETISEIAHGTGKRVMPSASERSKLATKARAGEDIGKPGKGFEKVAAKAAKQYGSKEAGARVAAAAMFKAQAKKG